MKTPSTLKACEDRITKLHEELKFLENHKKTFPDYERYSCSISIETDDDFDLDIELDTVHSALSPQLLVSKVIDFLNSANVTRAGTYGVIVDNDLKHPKSYMSSYADAWPEMRDYAIGKIRELDLDDYPKCRNGWSYYPEYTISWGGNRTIEVQFYPVEEAV